MESLTLREAAARTSRSVTTLRRHIRSGQLRAEKRNGRFGPEYFVTCEDLAAAGFAAEQEAPERREMTSSRRSPMPIRRSSTAPVRHDGVPITLYQELQLKHEQLLVQYGMIRAGGLRALELQQDLDDRDRQIAALRENTERAKAQARSAAGLREELHDARRELEARDLEVAALEAKVRALEMLTRNAVTNESIERQFTALREQAQRVDELSRPAYGESTEPAPRRESPPIDRDH